MDPDGVIEVTSVSFKDVFPNIILDRVCSTLIQCSTWIEIQRYSMDSITSGWICSDINIL